MFLRGINNIVSVNNIWPKQYLNKYLKCKPGIPDEASAT